jgi:hypothetical protein
MPYHNEGKDIEIVKQSINDNDIFGNPVVKSFSDKEYYNVPYFLIKSLAPYSLPINQNNMSKIFSEAICKLYNLISVRTTQLFLEGGSNPHYFLNGGSNVQPDEPGYFR